MPTTKNFQPAIISSKKGKRRICLSFGGGFCRNSKVDSKGFVSFGYASKGHYSERWQSLKEG